MEDKLKSFQKGFNHGYIISKHAPELAHLITKTPNDNSEYFQGLVCGDQEFRIEKVRQSLKSVSPENVQPKGLDKDIEKEK